MDVGFNNRNMFKDPRLKEVVFLVDTSSGKNAHSLWEEWSKGYAEEFGYKKIPTIPEKEITPLLEEVNNSIKIHNKKVDEENSHRVEWKQVPEGFATLIGELDKRPVYLEFSFAYINGHKIAFYEICSQVADYKMAEDYLKKNFQLTNDGYTRWNHTNSTNFHNCVNSLDRMDKEPRNTKYEG